MQELATQAFWLGLATIIGVNIVLSGDNAVVIALAARSLPPSCKKASWAAERRGMRSSHDRRGEMCGFPLG